jgi:hypothetical protein
VRFQPVAKDLREQIEQRAKEVRQVRAERQRLEAAMADRLNDPAGRSYQPGKVKAPRTPYVAAPIERLGKDDAPPPRIEAPQPDVKIEPKPRQPRGNAELPSQAPGTDREPRPERPKAEPRPERPKAEPRPEPAKVEPRPEPPKAEPRPERPKAEPRPERPKAEPRPEPPKAEPRPEPPKVEPKPEPPKAEPSPKPPRNPAGPPKGKGKGKPQN